MLNKLFLVLVTLVFVISCSQNNRADLQNDERILSNKRIKKAGITTSKLVNKEITDITHCSGTLEIPAENYHIISALSDGIINKIYINNGDFIYKGTPLVTFENEYIISLQQKYLKALAEFNYMHKEFTRQGELTIEDAASVKSMQIAEKEYLNSEAELYGIRNLLLMLRIQPDSIHIENIVNELTLIAPISGIITFNKIIRGGYIFKGQELFNITSTTKQVIKLKLKESDAFKASAGQEIQFYLASDSTNYYDAIITKKINLVSEDKFIDLEAEYNSPEIPFIPGMTVNALIAGSNVIVPFVDERAVIKINESKYVFVKENNKFTAIPVITGILIKPMIQLKNFPAEYINSDIVTNGSEYIGTLFDL